MKRVIKENLKVIFRIMKEHKIRSILSILGVAFGTFALIVMVSISFSMKEKSRLEAEKLGKNIIIVKSGLVRVFRKRQRTISSATTLKIRDAILIKQQIPYVKKVLPSFTITYPVRRKGTTIKTTIIGTTTDYPEVRSINVKEGRFFTQEEAKKAEKVAVLGAKVPEKLFKGENPIGKFILVFRVPVKVIGVMEEKGTDISGTDQDLLIYTPLKTAMRRLANVDYINTIFIQVDKKEHIPLVKREIRNLLRKLHKLKSTDKDDFTVLTPDDLLRMQSQAIRIFTILGLVSAAVSFAIGGIGILSVMILIVNERITEIGIRRAVGAKKRDILFQFMFESGFVSIVGGFVGLFLGLGLLTLIYHISDLPKVYPENFFLFALFVSITTGFLAGVYPAFKASSIKPIEALRR
ncbi:MAG: FtsX-like permease family protein [Aquificae bacterium]|nr:FtsX-like permease family protein [Aquificota bacterium]